MILDLPYTLTVDGIEREIFCDFRDVIQILTAYSDENLTNQDKAIVLLSNLYKDDFTQFQDTEDALKQAIWFIDWGKEYEDPKDKPRTMDWQQDYNMIVSAINQKIQTEIREKDFLHWWTFLGYFSERGECQFSTVISIREKLSKGQKLEKWEKEILRENRDTIMLKVEGDDDFENELWGD